MTRAGSLQVWALLIGGALVTWIVTYQRMHGMDEGPGTDLGGLVWFLGIWVTMMAAMMFPSVAPIALLHARVADGRSPTWLFLGGYLAVWSAFGLVAYALFRVIASLDLGFLSWDEHGPLVAGGAIVAAGIYQLTPLKRVCLKHCRTPLRFITDSWRDGRLGALRMGAGHGTFCVGCCLGLMLVLFVLGVMSLLWMAIVAALIFAEKVLPFGARLATVLAVCFLALGLWVATSPGTVPGLTQPAGPAMPSMP